MPPPPPALTKRHRRREGGPQHETVVYCPTCWAYHHHHTGEPWIRRAPRSWITATPGSANDVADIFLAVLRRCGAGVAIASVEFDSTDPRPKRLELRIHIRTRCDAEQAPFVFTFEFTVRDRLCDACGRDQAQADPDLWPAIVQVRQRAASPRTLNYLKSLLVRYCGNDSILRVDWDGSAGVLDLHFVSRLHAARFVRFVSTVAPAPAVGTALPPLASHDDEGKPYSFHVISVEICPVCQGDLVLLPVEASRALRGLGPLVLCIKVTSSLALLDTSNMRVVVVGVEEYDRYKFEPLLSRSQLVEYVVLGVQHDPSGDVTVLGTRYMMSWAQVARASDVGKNDTAVFTVKTHLGYKLEPGCHALGYDLCSDNAYCSHDGQSHTLPAAVLVTRCYDGEDWEESAGEMQQDGRGEGGVDIEEVAMGIGGMRLNPCGGEIDEVAMGIGCMHLNMAGEKDPKTM